MNCLQERCSTDLSKTDVMTNTGPPLEAKRVALVDPWGPPVETAARGERAKEHLLKQKKKQEITKSLTSTWPAHFITFHHFAKLKLYISLETMWHPIPNCVSSRSSRRHANSMPNEACFSRSKPSQHMATSSSNQFPHLLWSSSYAFLRPSLWEPAPYRT